MLRIKLTAIKSAAGAVSKTHYRDIILLKVANLTNIIVNETNRFLPEKFIFVSSCAFLTLTMMIAMNSNKINLPEKEMSFKIVQKILK